MIKKWDRPKGIIERYSIKKTTLFRLLREQKIKSKLIEKRQRLISIESVEEYINSH